MVKTILDGEPVCSCAADADGDGIVTDGEKAERPLASSGALVFGGCKSDDWVPDGYTYLTPLGPYFVREICKVHGELNTYVLHASVECSGCNCSSACIPPACAARCGTSVSECPADSFCSPFGECSACSPLGSGSSSYPECGGECGPCPDSSMCVAGTCTGLVRCVVAPSGTCSEKAPTWCPLLASTSMSGGPCYCDLSFECGNYGWFSARYVGNVE